MAGVRRGERPRQRRVAREGVLRTLRRLSPLLSHGKTPPSLSQRFVKLSEPLQERVRAPESLLFVEPVRIDTTAIGR
jgi:hypothetical protein